jgi:glycosyltransferase involved in cell wall biosynthesis
MPTYGRPDYVAESLAMFLAQDYPFKELIVLNDCPGQVFSGDIQGVRLLNVDSRYPTLGEKRNAIVEQARGELIAVWDDDDVYLPWRLSYSVEQIERLATPFFFPSEYWAYWGEGPLHVNQAIPDWISHPQFVFRRDLWDSAGRYPAQTFGEDTVLAWNMLKVLGQDWPANGISPHDRLFVLRAKSKYHHTSISGGEIPSDVTPGTIRLAPKPIDDPVLRNVVEDLIRARGSS